MKPNDLTPYIDNNALIDEVVSQVNKDFNSFDFHIEYSGNPEYVYQELSSQISAVIEELSRYNSSKCTALLYRIDIDESDTAHALSQTSFPRSDC